MAQPRLSLRNAVRALASTLAHFERGRYSSARRDQGHKQARVVFSTGVNRCDATRLAIDHC